MAHNSGEELIAYVWSFSGGNQEIPYRIMRKGRSKREGGEGAKFSCTCPSFANRGRRTCKHLTTFRQEAKDGLLLSDNRFDVSEFGKTLI